MQRKLTNNLLDYIVRIYLTSNYDKARKSKNSNEFTFDIIQEKIRKQTCNINVLKKIKYPWNLLCEIVKICCFQNIMLQLCCLFVKKSKKTT